MKKETAKKKHGFLRALLRILAVLLILALIIGIAVYYYSLYTKTHYIISFYQETSKKVSDNIRIAVIADIHDREYGENNEVLISDLRALKPDLILFPGDMVIREEDDYQPMLNLVSALTEIAPCYGVLGNHESERIYYGNDKDLPEKFENAGLKLLRNSLKKIRIGKDTIQLIGVEGTAYGFEEYGGREFMDKADIDPSAYSILMAHIPILFDSQLSGYGFDLGIAGHVHGGIVNFPFFGGLFSDEEGFFPKFTAGKYILDNQQTLIISAGLGDSKPFPPRINNTPELVVIDINRY
ncbi:MAG: metallophosphoesterase [Oscillospiraceae bacterium]|nr:metallophosphoesterase [Oscillospiraceae bacterium]